MLWPNVVNSSELIVAPHVNSFTIVTSSMNYCDIAVTDYSHIVPIEAFF